MVAILNLFVALFAVLLTIFLFLNSYAKETLGIIFPVAGATALSTYLLVNSIWVERPEERESLLVIGLLHDPATGDTTSLYYPSSDYSTMFELRGHKCFDRVRSFGPLSSSAFWSKLKETEKIDDAEYDKYFLEYIEYCLIYWFRENADLKVGYTGSEIVGLSGIGGAGVIRARLIPVALSHASGVARTLLEADPIQLGLPKGSKVILGERYGDIKIVTPNSRIKIRFTGHASLESFGVPATKRAGEVYNNLTKLGMRKFNQENPGVLRQYEMSISTSQIAYKRFSDQAKLEKKWLDYVSDQIEKDFGFESVMKLHREKFED